MAKEKKETIKEEVKDVTKDVVKEGKEEAVQAAEASTSEILPHAESKAPKSTRHGAFSLIDWVIILVVLGGIGYIAFSSHQAVQGANVETEDTAAVSSGLAPLPSLKVNRNHTRQGPEINVDQEQIGRDNPFLKP